MGTPFRIVRGPAWMLALAILAFAPAAASAAYTVGFYQISSNGNLATASQYTVTTLGSSDTYSTYYSGTLGTNEVLFVFQNTATISSSITDVYFQDGTLLGLSGITQSSGVSFDDPASPGNLPDGASVTPKFVTHTNWSADSAPPVSANGVNSSSEWLAVRFSLQSGQDYDDVVAAIQTGASGFNDNGSTKTGFTALRFGIHVQSINGAGSEAFINNPTNGGGGADPGVVPAPPAIVLAVSGLLCCGLGGLRSLRRKRTLAA